MRQDKTVTCGKCGGTGHNVRTCGKSATPAFAPLSGKNRSSAPATPVPGFAAMQSQLDAQLAVVRGKASSSTAVLTEAEHPEYGTWDSQAEAFFLWTDSKMCVGRDIDGLLHTEPGYGPAWRYVDDDSDPWREEQREYWHGIIYRSYEDSTGISTVIRDLDFNNIHPEYGIWSNTDKGYLKRTVTVVAGRRVGSTTLRDVNGKVLWRQ